MSHTTDVSFMINTYNRHESLLKLIKSIHDVDRKIDIYIVDDGSNPPIEQYSEKIKWNPFIHVYHQGHKGKMFYWQTCNYLIEWVNKTKIKKYYYMLPDDVVLNENFLEDTQNKYEEIRSEDSSLLLLNLIADRCNKKEKSSLACWTAYEPEWIEKLQAWKTNWNDMAFCTTKTFFKHFQLIPEIKRDWVQYDDDGNVISYRQLGSGVGSYISRNYTARRFTMYMPFNSFVTFQDSHKKSKMNPKLKLEDING